MPAHDGLWSNQYERRSPVRPDALQGNPKQPVAGLQARPTVRPLHRHQLLPERQVLQDNFPMPLGVPAPARDRRPSTTGACLDPGGRGRRNQLGRVLARVTLDTRRELLERKVMPKLSRRSERDRSWPDAVRRISSLTCQACASSYRPRRLTTWSTAELPTTHF